MTPRLGLGDWWRRRSGRPGSGADQGPLQEPGTLPPGRYVFAVESVPQNYAGRTSSILAKIRTFSSQPGVECSILVVDFAADLPAVSTAISRRGVLPVPTLRSLYCVLDPAGDPVSAGTRLSTSAGGEVETREIDAAGTLRLRRRTRDGDSRPYREEFWRADGSLAFVRSRTPNADDPQRIDDLVVPHDPDGGAGPAVSWPRFVHSMLDRLVDEAPSHLFMSVEARVVDRVTLGWRNPLASAVYVLHNPHLLPPYDQIDRVRGGFKGVLRRGEHVTAVFLTEAQRADAVAHYGPSAHWWVIPHAVRPITSAGPAECDADLIVQVGRLHPQKRMTLAIDAMAELVRTRPTARLEIYGDGDLRDDLQRHIDERNLNDHVRLAGYAEDVDALYRRAAVSLLTSEYEGLGLVLVESLANGCPAVACDVRYGPRDIITDGHDGLLCDSTPEAVAAALDRLLGDSALRKRLAAAGPAIVSRYSEQVFLERWSALFSSLGVTQP